MKGTKRRTGRTSRLALECTLSLLKGKKAFILSKRLENSERILIKISDILDALYLTHFYKRMKGQLILKNGARVDAINEQQYYAPSFGKGIEKPLYIFYDDIEG